MVEIFSLLMFGFLFGLRHAFDADHIAAVSILSLKTKNKSEALFRGISWGMGHTILLLALGFLMFILGIRIPESLSEIFESLVSLLLIGLGFVTLLKFFKSREKVSDAVMHTHPPMGIHFHPSSFLVGVIHGLAGSGVLLILIVSIMKSALLGLTYILVFGLGSIIGMGIVSFFFGKFALKFQKFTTVLAGLFSLILGLSLL